MVLLKGALEGRLIRVGHRVLGEIPRIRVEEILEVVGRLQRGLDVFLQRHVRQIIVASQGPEDVGEAAAIMQRVQRLGVLVNRLRQTADEIDFAFSLSFICPIPSLNFHRVG